MISGVSSSLIGDAGRASCDVFLLQLRRARSGQGRARGIEDTTQTFRSTSQRPFGTGTSRLLPMARPRGLNVDAETQRLPLGGAHSETKTKISAIWHLSRQFMAHVWVDKGCLRRMIRPGSAACAKEAKRLSAISRPACVRPWVQLLLEYDANGIDSGRFSEPADCWSLTGTSCISGPS